jgi:hypothetical protein
MNINIKTNLTGTDKHKCHSPAALALALVGVMGSMSMVNTAQAVTLYQTGFENPPFVLAPLTVSPVQGQDGWVVGGGPDGDLSPNAAVISTNRPRQGKQSVLVNGADLVQQGTINFITGGYYDAIGSYRKTVDYDTGGTKTVRVSAHVRVDGRQTATGNNFFSAGIGSRGADIASTNGGGTTGNGELAISSDGHVYGYSGDDFVPGCPNVPCTSPASFLTSSRISLGEWHNLAVELNFATRKMTFFVDDECLGSFPFVSGFTGNFVRRGAMLVYTAPDTATLHKANYRARYDQYSIKTVTPEECHR